MKIDLTLNQISLLVHLGWGEEEREVPQKIWVDISIQFSSLPVGCQTDELSDTVCYATLAKSLKKFCENRSFKLIEHLTHEIYTMVKKEVHSLPISVTLTKFPPTKNLHHCTFTLKDE